MSRRSRCGSAVGLVALAAVLLAAGCKSGKAGAAQTSSASTGAASVSSPASAQAEVPADPEVKKLWDAALSAAPNPSRDDLDQQHDKWMETVRRLEECRDRQPNHPGILRDLVLAYANLLAFESGSSLGGNLCLLASTRSADLEKALGPAIGESDRQAIRGVRAWVCFVMRLYPLAARECDQGGGDSSSAAVAGMLEAIGQRRFVAIERFEVGPVEVRSYEAADRSPDAGLLWGQTVFIVRPSGDDRPHAAVAYVLTRSGRGERERHDLYFHSLNRSVLLRAYGPRAPGYDELRAGVAASARQALAKGASPEVGP